MRLTESIPADFHKHDLFINMPLRSEKAPSEHEIMAKAMAIVRESFYYRNATTESEMKANHIQGTEILNKLSLLSTNKNPIK